MSIVIVLKNISNLCHIISFLHRFKWERESKYLFVYKDVSIRILLEEQNETGFRGLRPDIICTEQKFTNTDILYIHQVYECELSRLEKLSY